MDRIHDQVARDRQRLQERARWRVERIRRFVNGIMIAAVYAGAMAFGVGLGEFGCAHDPASKARQVVIGAYAADGAAATFAEIAAEKCAADALLQPTKEAKQTALDKCRETHATLLRVLMTYVDTMKSVAAGIDAGESIAAKDFGSALAPLYGAGVQLAKALTDAGVKIPIPIPGVN